MTQGEACLASYRACVQPERKNHNRKKGTYTYSGVTTCVQSWLIDFGSVFPGDPLFLSLLGRICCRTHRSMGAPFGRPPRLFVVGSVVAFASSSRDLQVDPSSPSSLCCCSFAYLGWCSCACIFDVKLGKL